MENVFLKVSVEMGLKGWEEQRSVVSDKECRAVWKKKGDVGEWMFLMESCPDDKDVVCLTMSLKAGKEFAARTKEEADLMMVMDIEDVLDLCRGAIVRMLHKSTGGGYLCQAL